MTPPLKFRVVRALKQAIYHVLLFPLLVFFWILRYIVLLIPFWILEGV
jgi:hypothetical protein